MEHNVPDSATDCLHMFPKVLYSNANVPPGSVLAGKVRFWAGNVPELHLSIDNLEILSVSNTSICRTFL